MAYILEEKLRQSFQVYSIAQILIMTEIFDDIRKLYLFRVPCPELSEHIDFFSENSLEATYRYIQDDCFTVKLFPSFTPNIWLNMGAPYQLFMDGKIFVLNGKRI